VACACLIGALHGERGFAKAIERFGFAEQVVKLPEQQDRLLVVVCGLLMVALLAFDGAEASK